MPRVEYVTATWAIVDVLKKSGGLLGYEELVAKTIAAYTTGEKKATIRVFRKPDGGLWSPEIEEAVKLLQEAGIIRIVNGRVFLVDKN